ncbi:MAG: HNH endonuclease signature motif containing protein [Bdellovibrionia bacterium]
MNLKNLSDDLLIQKISELVSREREILTDILHHLREIERRRLFSALGFSSLFDYCVKKLGYSEDQAYRRINAMRLLRDMPEVEAKISSGAISLSNLSLAQSLFKQERKTAELTKDRKLEILSQLENKSARDAKKFVLQYSSQPIRMDERTKQISPNYVEYTFVADSNLDSKIKKLKGLVAHALPNASTADLINRLCDLGLEKWDPSRQKTRTRRSGQSITNDGPENSPWTSKNRRVKISLRRDVWKKDGGRCSNCESEFALEVDHIQPVAKGGQSTSENLRLLCRTCNQRSAIEQLGEKTMERYLS